MLIFALKAITKSLKAKSKARELLVLGGRPDQATIFPQGNCTRCPRLAGRARPSLLLIAGTPAHVRHAPRVAERDATNLVRKAMRSMLDSKAGSGSLDTSHINQLPHHISATDVRLGRGDQQPRRSPHRVEAPIQHPSG